MRFLSQSIYHAFPTQRYSFTATIRCPVLSFSSLHFLTIIRKLDEGKAIKIALGNIDPISGETLADFTEFLVRTSNFYIFVNL